MSETEGSELARQLGMTYMETSAKDPPQNIDDAFREVSEYCLQRFGGYLTQRGRRYVVGDILPRKNMRLQGRVELWQKLCQFSSSEEKHFRGSVTLKTVAKSKIDRGM